jgi:hypothetical protein
MPFVLHPYAAVKDGYITRFINDEADIAEGEIALPVIADPDPVLAPDERVFGPDYEVLADRVRAYGRAVKAEPHEIVKMTFAQLLIGLVAEAWITEAEGDAWLAGTLPAPVLALISTLPPEARFPAKARAISPSEVIRHDPLVVMLGAAQGKTAEELDTFFATYSQA